MVTKHLNTHVSGSVLDVGEWKPNVSCIPKASETTCLIEPSLLSVKSMAWKMRYVCTVDVIYL